jgi:hypothetical protein
MSNEALPRIVVAIDNDINRLLIGKAIELSGVPRDAIILPKNIDQVLKAFRNGDNAQAVNSSLIFRGRLVGDFLDGKEVGMRVDDGIELVQEVLRLRSGVEAAIITDAHPERILEMREKNTDSDVFIKDNILMSVRSLVEETRVLLLEHFPIFSQAHGLESSQDSQPIPAQHSLADQVAV